MTPSPDLPEQGDPADEPDLMAALEAHLAAVRADMQQEKRTPRGFLPTPTEKERG